jgi:predicted AAA+ superfamily ATPase
MEGHMGISIPSFIARPLYLEKISPYIGKNIIKVLVGQRRVGKSYLLYQIMAHIRKIHPKSTLIYINKELHDFAFIRNGDDLLAYIKKEVATGTTAAKKACLFIDEVQDIAGFEKALRSLVAQEKFDIYCTGSNAFLLSGELATYLSGRHVEIKVYGLSYPEFLVFHKLIDNNDSLLKYMKFGGLPYLINLELEERIVYDYLQNIYNAILYKDVVRRFRIRNVSFLERLTEYCADNVGSLVSAKKISDFLKSQKIAISPNIALNYLSFLCAAFFILRTPRSEIKSKKVFEIGEKYYFEDLGLRHSITGYRQSDIGKILENLVFLHLKTSGFDVTVGKLGDKEIDFVAEKSGEKMYVQVAYLIPDQKAHDREFGNLLSIADNYRKVVVSMDEPADGNDRGIEHVHIRKFLSGK